MTAGLPEALALAGAVGDAFARLSGPGVSETRARLAAQDVSAASFAPPEARRQPALAFLDAALEAASATDAALATALAGARPYLRWDRPAYPAERVGRDFAERVCWCDWIGPGGFFPGDDFTSGFLLMAPGVTYPDHWHPAPELYLPLTAPSLWSVDGAEPAPRPAGGPIWHAPRQLHATVTLAEPLLALYAWPRDTAEGPFLAGNAAP